MTIQYLYEQKLLIMILAGLFLLGVIIKLCIGRCYQNLISAAEEMNQSEHKLMKTILLKFETCYKLKLNVTNVDTFIEKYLLSYQTKGFYLYTWENIGTLLLIVTMAVSIIGGILGVYYDISQVAFFSTILSGFIFSGLFILIDSMINLTMKKKILRIHIKDYLENIYRPRLENEVFHPEEMEKYRDEYFIKEKDEDSKPQEELEKLEKEVEFHFDLSKEEKKVLEEVLNEYIT